MANRFVLRSIFLVGYALLVQSSALIAQVPGPDPAPAVISRMCLWNADKATWKAMGADRDQVRRLHALRELYPAVVEGQWVEESELDVARVTHLGRNSHSASGSTAHDPAYNYSLPGIFRGDPEAVKLPSALQRALREVLSNEQISVWADHCNQR